MFVQSAPHTWGPDGFSVDPVRPPLGLQVEDFERTEFSMEGPTTAYGDTPGMKRDVPYVCVPVVMVNAVAFCGKRCTAVCLSFG